MVSPKESDQDKLVSTLAGQLEGKIKMPAWALYVKTGVSKERPPEQANWWYLRAASVLRKIYIDGPIGVSRLSTYYGGRHRRGHKQAHFARGSGKILRTILIDLEKTGYVKKNEKPKGRVITPAGMKLLSSVSKSISK